LLKKATGDFRWRGYRPVPLRRLETLFASILVPFAIGAQQQVLRIRRLNDGIEVARIPGSSV
jgi:hypothetical protein